MESPTVSSVQSYDRTYHTFWFVRSCALIAHLSVWVLIYFVWNLPWLPVVFIRGICATLAIGQAFVVAACVAEWTAVSCSKYRRWILPISAIATCVLTAFYVERILSIRMFLPFSPRVLALAMVWSLVPLIAWYSTRVAMRYIRIVRIDGPPDCSPFPMVSLRWIFGGMAAFALLIGAGRSIPNHIMDATPFVMLISSIALAVIGPSAIVVVPTWAAFTNYSIATRIIVFTASTLTIGLLIPFSFVMPWQAWPSFLFAILYIKLLKFMTWLPIRYNGLRLISTLR
jgi:hypothetical protein